MSTTSVSWTHEHTLAAFHLYTLLPFGRLSQGTPEIRQLAKWQGRTASSLAMKLVNFASLDPEIRSSGRAGLSGASRQDRELWAQLQSDWDATALKAADAYARLAAVDSVNPDDQLLSDPVAELQFPEGANREALVQVRVNQARFRRAVLASYNSTCCISGLRHPSLVVASHIVPWSRDARNRLNPHNGLCLSALHDRAFDQGLITVLPSLTVRVSPQLLEAAKPCGLLADLVSCHEKPIARPERFAPNTDFLAWHANRFGFI